MQELIPERDISYDYCLAVVAPPMNSYPRRSKSIAFS